MVGVEDAMGHRKTAGGRRRRSRAEAKSPNADGASTTPARANRSTFQHLLWPVTITLFAAMAMLAVASAFFAPQRAETPALDAKRAYGYLLKVCRIGPRVSGTQGMAEQQKLIAEHFTKLGAKVGYQAFDVAHPLTGDPVRMQNMIVSWHPEAERRVLICCHYDTRPFPDMDPINPRGRFIGANDGGSGVALLMELGHAMPKLETNVGVDFVFFDGEELIYPGRGQEFIGVPNAYRGYFLGSEHFARQYREHPPEHRYLAGVLIDMVADRNLNLYKERNSLKYARKVTDSLWQVAADVGVREFVDRERHEVLDDHIPLNEIARIPTCDIIDFDYPYWHTTQDVPARCSGASLEKVGRVLLAWLAAIDAP